MSVLQYNYACMQKQQPIILKTMQANQAKAYFICVTIPGLEPTSRRVLAIL